MSSTPNTPIWPPIRAKRPRITDENEAPHSTPRTPQTPTPGSHRTPVDLEVLRLDTRNTSSAKKQFQNGFEKTPKPIPFKAYQLNSSKALRNKPFAFPVLQRLSPMEPLSTVQWNQLAHHHKLLHEPHRLRDYQVEGANWIIGRKSDLCVVAPTGAGKSTLWMLPLLAQKGGVSLVIVPFTSLGVQGENRHQNLAISATFLHSGNSETRILERIAKISEMHVVYVCPEMLETPAVARILHSASFQAQLSAVYIDEAHVVHESVSWRPSYGRLYLLRQVLGTRIPLVIMSATLPPRYRDSLTVHAGLRPQYHLINLGNFREELRTIVKLMQHAASSFLDLLFIFDLAATTTIIIYCDNLETLTEMFWWIYKHLISSRLPVSWLDILHAGLSETHQRQCIEGVSSGRVKILLGSEKIGAGMDFPSVGLVIQYQCRGLSIVRWEQRRGRGARREGETAAGIILVEKSMAGKIEGSPTVTTPKSEDPGLVDLVQTDRCLQHCTDKWLDNPDRGDSLPCPRCSNCNPSLRDFTNHYTFMLEDFHKAPGKNSVSDTAAQKIHKALVKWRMETWKSSWRDDWPSYGPEDLVSTADLQALAERALNITTIDNIDSIASIAHLHELGPSLLTAISTAARRFCGEQDVVDAQPPLRVEVDIPAALRWQEPQNADSIQAANSK
ncbi:ATP-dependent DNA helicase [Ephemerocybe angulata]|uniref:DNA 3'-5' helicase n=1 Tax=Ephemerocybe angulata TaxID=980116 RepID=A0A8H6HAA8_9AGAR|nr:ATP-dependent DNA helicase [Tulosesus angulatus]